MHITHSHTTTKYICSYSMLSFNISRERFSPLATILPWELSFVWVTDMILKSLAKNQWFLRYSIRMPYILCFKTDAFPNRHFKMHLVQLPSIYNTIQFISDISSLNVWTTLCLSHSVPGGLWKGLTRYHFPICMFFLSKQLFKAQLYILIDSEDVVIQVAVALWRRENKSTLLDKAERKGHVGKQLSRRSRNDPCPHFRSPTCGAGCLSILKQKALRLTLLFQGLHCGYMAREC